MRPFRRYSLPRKIVAGLVMVAALACAVVCVCGARAQGVSAQGGVGLPAAWSAAVNTLADKVAAAVSPTRPVSLTVKNISSLDAGEADAIREAFEAQLAQHRFRLTRTGAATETRTDATRIGVTLSESDDAYVWLAEIHSKDDDEDGPVMAVVSVEKASGAGGDDAGRVALTLQKTLEWQQSEKFLDFRVVADASGAAPTLLVLEPSRIAIYEQAAGKWNLDGAAAVNHRVPWPRDVRGTLNESASATVATISGVPCMGTAAKGAAVACAGTLVNAAALALIPGRDTGEAVVLGKNCDGGAVALASGTGDWTQADAIRGYVLRKNQATASGAAVEFDGPVIAMVANGDAGSARAIVLNLKTENYEGYVVTATCGE